MMDDSVPSYHKSIVNREDMRDVSDEHEELLATCIEIAHTRSNPLPVDHAGVYKQTNTSQHTLVVTIDTTDIVDQMYIQVTYDEGIEYETAVRDFVLRTNRVEDMLWQQIVEGITDDKQ